LLIGKRGGAGAAILPMDVTSVEDIPADLTLVIDHGYKIISWQENLTEEEMPPRWMWHLDWELEKWFEEIDALRKSKYAVDDREDTLMDQNEDPEVRKMKAERFGR